jgi:hypothetical protein
VVIVVVEVVVVVVLLLLLLMVMMMMTTIGMMMINNDDSDTGISSSSSSSNINNNAVDEHAILALQCWSPACHPMSFFAPSSASQRRVRCLKCCDKVQADITWAEATSWPFFTSS